MLKYSTNNSTVIVETPGLEPGWFNYYNFNNVEEDPHCFVKRIVKSRKWFYDSYECSPQKEHREYLYSHDFLHWHDV